eukprot:4850309-Pyramimonas_sp.AAC.1
MAGCGAQIPDEEKRRRADYIIDTSCSLQETEATVAGLVQMLSAMREGADITAATVEAADADAVDYGILLSCQVQDTVRHLRFATCLHATVTSRHRQYHFPLPVSGSNPIILYAVNQLGSQVAHDGTSLITYMYDTTVTLHRYHHEPRRGRIITTDTPRYSITSSRERSD